MEKYWSPADINSVVRNELIDIFPELTYKFMSEVDSTNGLLKTWAYEDKIKPVFLLLAGRQNAGRGRKNGNGILRREKVCIFLCYLILLLKVSICIYIP